MNLMAGSLCGNAPAIHLQRLSVLSIVVNNACNLNCHHCYLRPGGPTIGLKPQHWLQFLRSVFADLRPEFLCFSGKEIFVSNESASLFFDALRLREAVQGNGSDWTRVGVITNGTLLEPYRDELSHCPPDWLDVSIDGLPQQHDAIRGRGAFAKMAGNLPWLIRLLGDRVWVTPTLTETNLDSLPEIVSFLLREFGLKRFAVGLYRPQGYTSSLLRIRNDDRESRILRSLDRLRVLDNAYGVEVKLDIDSSDHVLRERLESSGLLPSRGVLRMSKRTFENGLTLKLSTTVVPVGLWRAVRVSNEGQWLAAEDLVDARAYGRRAIANIAEFDYDARRLYANGLSHPRFEELLGMTAERFFCELARSA